MDTNTLPESVQKYLTYVSLLFKVDEKDILNSSLKSRMIFNARTAVWFVMYSKGFTMADCGLYTSKMETTVYHNKVSKALKELPGNIKDTPYLDDYYTSICKQFHIEHHPGKPLTAL